MSDIITRHDDMDWKVLSSERVIDRPWMHVRRDSVQLPGGTVHPEYYIIEYPTWVNVIAITDDGHFVMIRQYRHGIRQARYEMVAGCAEEGESPLEAARRELLEETGYSGGDWQQYMVLSANPSTTDNLTYTFLARGVKPTGAQHLDRTEDIQVHLLTPDQLFTLLSGGEIMQALMAAALWRYFYDLRFTIDDLR